MGQSGYTPPPIGGPGGGYWVPIAGGAIQNTNPNGIDVVAGFFRTLINNALAALGFQDLAGGNEAYIVSTNAPDMTIHTATPLFASSVSVAPNQIQSVTTDITSGAAVTDSQDANIRTLDLNDGAGSDCLVTLTPIMFKSDVLTALFESLILLEPNKINIACSDLTTGAALKVAMSSLVFDLLGPGGVKVFEIDNTGKIETNQNIAAPATVTPAVYNNYIPIYDTTGALLGNVPLF